MFKAMMYATVAAIVTFFSMSAVSAVISRSGIEAGNGISTTSSADNDAVRLKEMQELRNHLNARESTIKILRNELVKAHNELATARDAASPGRMASELQTLTDALDRAGEQLWSETQRLDTGLALAQKAELQARQQFGMLLVRTKMLEEAITARDASIASLESRLRAEQTGRRNAAIPDEDLPHSEYANKRLSKNGAFVETGQKTPSLNGEPDARTGTGRAQTVEDGVAAYHDGRFRDAFDIWRPLAAAGTARAQFHLGALYFEGRGVVRDLGEAQEWLTKARVNGEPNADIILELVRKALANG